MAYTKLRDRLKGFNAEIEPIRAKKKLVCNNTRGYIKEDWEDKIPYTHPALFGPGYPPDLKINACMAWVLTGSPKRAERMTGVPAQTISAWKRNATWWPEVELGCKANLQSELEGKYTHLMHLMVDEAIDRVENGDIKYDSHKDKYVEVPISAKDLASMSAIFFDKRALMRGDPTSRTEKVSTDAILGHLKEEFKRFAQAKTIDSKPEPNDED